MGCIFARVDGPRVFYGHPHTHGNAAPKPYAGHLACAEPSTMKSVPGRNGYAPQLPQR